MDALRYSKTQLTVGVSFIYILYISLHTPSTTHEIRVALEALQLNKWKQYGISSPFFLLILQILPY